MLVASSNVYYRLRRLLDCCWRGFAPTVAATQLPLITRSKAVYPPTTIQAEGHRMVRAARNHVNRPIHLDGARVLYHLMQCLRRSAVMMTKLAVCIVAP